MHMIYVVVFFMPCVLIFSKWSSTPLQKKKDKHFGTSYTRKRLLDFSYHILNVKLKFRLNLSLC